MLNLHCNCGVLSIEFHMQKTNESALNMLSDSYDYYLIKLTFAWGVFPMSLFGSYLNYF